MAETQPMLAASKPNDSRYDTDDQESAKHERKVEVYENYIEKVKGKGHRDPRTIADIEDSWQPFVFDVALGFMGLLPCVGIAPLTWLWYKYYFTKRDLLLRTDDRLATVSVWWSVCISFYILVFDSIFDSVVYFEQYTAVRAGEMSVGFWLDSLQVSMLSNLCSICSMLFGPLLIVASLEVYVDVSYYKQFHLSVHDESQEGRCPPEYADYLEKLEKYFPKYFEAEDHPPVNARQLHDRKLADSLSLFDTILIAFALLSMASGLGFMIWKLAEHDEVTIFSFISLCVSGVVILQNFHKLLVKLLRSAVTIRKNAAQLLLFSSFVTLQDFGALTQENRDTIRRIFSELQDDLEEPGTDDDSKCCVCQWKVDCLKSRDVEGKQTYTDLRDIDKKNDKIEKGKKLKDLLASKSIKKPSGDTEEPYWRDTQLNLLIQKVDEAVFDKTMSFDLTKTEDIERWWALRRYIQIDFKDESLIMNYCSSCTLATLISFLISGAWDWTLHKNYFFIGFYGHCGGLLLAFGVSLSLAMILFTMLQVCISINELQDRDSVLLLVAARKLRFRTMQRKEGSASEEQNGETVAQLLITLDKELQRYDDRQTLFGFPITANLRNALLAAIAATLVSYVWESLYPVFKDADVEELAKDLLLLNSSSVSH